MTKQLKNYITRYCYTVDTSDIEALTTDDYKTLYNEVADRAVNYHLNGNSKQARKLTAYRHELAELAGIKLPAMA